AAVRRLGVLRSLELSDRATNILRTEPTFFSDGVVIRKLLVCDQPWRRPGVVELDLEHTERFVEQRAAQFADVKNRDRTYFSAGAFQYAIRRAVRLQRQQDN